MDNWATCYIVVSGNQRRGNYFTGGYFLFYLTYLSKIRHSSHYDKIAVDRLTVTVTLNMTYILPAGLCEAHPCRYCFYSVVQKWVFRPAGATRCPDKRKTWHGSKAGPLPRAKFHVYRGRNVIIQPPKLSKFRILAINLPLRGDSCALFLQNSLCLYASIGNL